MTVTEALGLAMLVSMVFVIFIGFPISFTLLFLALVFGAIGAKCTGRPGRNGRGGRKAARRPAVPARYLLAAPRGISTSSPTTCGCTAAGSARRPSSRC